MTLHDTSPWAPPRRPIVPPPPTPLGTPLPMDVLALAVLTTVFGGLLLGIGTQVAQGELPGNWNVLANSGVAWALGAAVIGLCMPTVRAAAAGGAASLVLASVSYYWAVEQFEGVGSNPRSALIWSAAGIAAGAVFGVAGHLVRVDPARRWLALGLVAGVVGAEGWYLVGVVPHLRMAGFVELVLATILVVVCLGRDRRSAAVLALAAAGAAASAMSAAAIQVGFDIPV